MDSINVLVIEDNPADARLIREGFAELTQPELKVFYADRLATGLDQLLAEPIQVVLLDLSLPDSAGIATLQRVHGAAAKLPIIVLTGLEDEALGLEAMRHGAQDYLVKGQTDNKRLARILLFAMERKRTERLQQLSYEILGILSEPLAFSAMANRILAAIKRETQCDAMGVRLRSGEDFPYFVQKGFAEDFLLLENSLLACNESGGICRDETGKPCLECACGLVLLGQTDAVNPLFTADGSVWTNNSPSLLELPADRDLRRSPRNNCIYAGYNSFALIPIRTNREIIGLLQICHKKPNQFTLEIVRLLEAICANIGSALMRLMAEDALKSSQARYRALMEQSFEALALVDIEKREVVEVNRRFTELFGYSLPEDAPLTLDKYMTDSQEHTDEIYNTILREQRVLPAEVKLYRHKNGAEVHGERAGTVVSIDGRDYLLGSMRDMTTERRRQAEMNRDVELARRVQRELLPKLPESPFVKVRTLYYPANFVSGDSYHLEWRNDGQLLRGFLIDISGHGLATAIQTSAINVLLREAEVGKLPLLGQMRRINARAAKYFTEGAYAALLGFELDLARRELRYVGAGITQFYANGKKIEVPGMFIGMWENAEFTAGVIPIKEGESFLFLTDGFTDELAKAECSAFVSVLGQDFDADVTALEKMAERGGLRDDATGVCLTIKAKL